ncbi:MAG: ABC transporter permease [Saprospiraceae bacterium]
MFRNYFNIAWRNLLRNRTYTILNVLGLTVGIVCSLLLYTVINHELSFDTFHSKKDRIYRFVTESEGTNGTDYTGAIPRPLPATMRETYPQLEAVAPVFGVGAAQMTVLQNNQKFREEQGVFATDPYFFNIFDVEWLSADASATLGEPEKIVLTQEVADRYFGNWQQAVGKTIRWNNQIMLNVTGVIKDFPVNTDIPVKALISIRNSNRVDWVSISSDWYCFALLKPNVTAAQFNAMMPGFTKKHRPADAHKAVHRLQSLRDMHFDERFNTPSGRTFSKATIWSLALVGAFLLLMACVNFINLATVQAMRRSKEVGVRKVLGGNRGQLLGQFLAETALIVVTAVIVAAGIAQLTMPLISRILEFPDTLQVMNHWGSVAFLFVLTLVVIVLSGFYPALVLSGFNPIEALKSRLQASGNASLRRALVVFQFAIAQVLIFGMLVVVNQMEYFQHKNLGFNHKDPVIMLPVPGDSLSQTKTGVFKTELQRQLGVTGVSLSFNTPADDANWYTPFRYDNATKDTDFAANMKMADPDYFKMYDISFVAGQSYAQNDTFRAFVVNETLLKKLGVQNPQEAIGKEINLWDGYYKAPIVGVVKDFHAETLQQEIPPLLIFHSDNYGVANIKLEAAKVNAALPVIEKSWNSIYPEYVFDYQFLDEKIANFYQRERQMSQLYKIAALIAIIIGCLGLFGLASFTAEQRIKEIGIRKVLGATTGGIVAMLSKDFLRLVLIAGIIAFPIGWYLMNNWLADFAYRLHIQWWMFVAVAFSALFIALLTVSVQAIRAAWTNPVESLRTE